MLTTRYLPCRFLLVVFAIVAFCWEAYSQQLPAGTGPAAGQTVLIAQPTISKEGQKTVVRVEANGPLLCQPIHLTDPERLALDFPGTRLGAGSSNVSSTRWPVRKVRSGQFKPGTARVVIDLEQGVAYKILSQQNSIAVEFDSAPLATGPTPRIQASTQRKDHPPRPSETTVSAPPAAARTSPSGYAPGISEPEYSNGMLTLHVQGQTIRSLLEQIGSRTRIGIHLPDGLGGEQISVSFDHYRVDEALRQMLSEYSVAFFYGGQDQIGEAGTLKSVWVFPKGKAPTDLAFEQRPQFAATPEKKLLEPGPLPSVALASEAPVQASKQELPGKDLEALRDVRPDVRLAALSRAMTSGAEVPQSTLIDLALKDEESGVRLLALRSLPIEPDLRWVAEQALSDSSRSVNQLAAEILRRLDTADRAKYWTTQVPPPSGQ
jgi:hypothetical protein